MAALIIVLIKYLVLSLVSISMSMSMMMRAAHYEPGGPELLTVQDLPVPELNDKEILLQVHASAINRADTLQRKGLYPPPPGASNILGLEAVGAVHKLGSRARKWKLGDRVMALLSGGGNAEYVAVHEDHVLPIPSALSYAQAAAIPEVWLTAFQLLTTVGHVSAGETVLIHAGGSGVGTAAVQLTKLLGAVSVITAGTPGKLDRAHSLGAAHGINYKEEDFAHRVLEITNGRGVDLILDCIGGSYWEKNAAAIAIDGRWVVYGLMGGGSVNGDVLAKLLRKRATITGTTLRSRSIEYKSQLVANFSHQVLPHFSNGTLEVVVDRVLPLEDISEAHRCMEANENTGKIILQVRKEAKQEL